MVLVYLPIGKWKKISACLHEQVGATDTTKPGHLLKGAAWNRKTNDAGVAFVLSGLSEPHKNYLKLGGKGFIIGDGNLNYATEWATEIYYGMSFFKNIVKLTGFYQLFVNPGYNADRGPVSVFSVRLHIEK